MTNKRKFHCDLFALVEWTAGIAFLCALFAGSGSRASWTYDFATLPDKDTALTVWLEEQGHTNVRVNRDGNSVTLTADSSIFSKSSFTGSVANPPWEALGYRGLKGKHGSMQWTMFSGSPYLWIVGFGILIALGLLRRWYIKPRADV